MLSFREEGVGVPARPEFLHDLGLD